MMQPFQQRDCGRRSLWKYCYCLVFMSDLVTAVAFVRIVRVDRAACVVLVPIISFIYVEWSILLNVQGNNGSGAAVFPVVSIRLWSRAELPPSALRLRNKPRAEYAAWNVRIPPLNLVSCKSCSGGKIKKNKKQLAGCAANSTGPP